MRVIRHLFLALAGPALLLAPAPLPAAPAPGDDLLATFAGGELRFSEVGDPGFPELRGEARSAAICAASYREIYARIGARKGLDKTAAFSVELAAARRRLAAELYRRKRQPNFAARLTAAELEAEWQRRSLPGGDLHQPGQIDMDVLYLRCSVLPAERGACAQRAAEIDAQLHAGVPFIDLVGAERERSGNANGSYSAAPLEKLSSELRQLAEATPAHSLSPWLEVPHGLFRLQVLDRRGAGPRPLFTVEPQLRRELAERRVREWEEAERRRLDPRGRASCEEALAAAAERAGDTRDPAFAAALAGEKARLLASAAYAADREARPSDSQLEAERQARAAELEELVLLIFALPFGERPGDAKASYTRAGEVADALTRGAANLPAALAALPAGFPDLRVEQVGPLRRREIEEALPDFAKALAGAGAGTWRGPIPLATEGLWHLVREDRGVGARPPEAGGRSLAFVAVLQRAVPPLSQLRRELLRPKLAELEGGGVYCRELLSSRFALEILPPAPEAGVAR